MWKDLWKKNAGNFDPFSATLTVPHLSMLLNSNKYRNFLYYICSQINEKNVNNPTDDLLENINRGLDLFKIFYPLERKYERRWTNIFHSHYKSPSVPLW